MRQAKSTRHHESILDGNVEASARLAAVAVERTQLGCHPYAHEVTTNNDEQGHSECDSGARVCHMHTCTLRKPIRLRRSSWSPVRTGMWRQDRWATCRPRGRQSVPTCRARIDGLATICPSYDSGSPAEPDAGARRMSGGLPCPPSLSLFSAFSGLLKYEISAGCVGTRHRVVSGASGPAGSTCTRRSQAGRRSPEVSRDAYGIGGGQLWSHLVAVSWLRRIHSPRSGSRCGSWPCPLPPRRPRLRLAKWSILLPKSPDMQRTTVRHARLRRR